jgi:hypothetical protein
MSINEFIDHLWLCSTICILMHMTHYREISDPGRAWAQQMVELVLEMSVELQHNLEGTEDRQQLAEKAWRTAFLKGQRIAQPEPQDRITPLSGRRLGDLPAKP